jgi:hypothetical protein
MNVSEGTHRRAQRRSGGHGWLGRCRTLVVVLLLSVAAPAHALAQSEVDFSQIQDVARAKAEEGLALYGEQKWGEAYERFRLAEDLFHAPTLVLFMGHCKRELGALVEARSLYLRIAEEEVSDDAPAAFADAVATARQQVQTLDERIPQLTIQVTGATASEVRIQVDGQPVTLDAGPVLVDPGKHSVVATAPDRAGVNQTLELAEADRETFDIVFRKIELAPPRPTPLPPPPPPEPDPGSLLPAMIAGGVGLAGFVVGGIAGGLSLSKVSDIKAECDGTVCPDRLQGDADSAQTLATVSNVGLIVGGVGAALSVTFVFWRPWADDAPIEAGLSPTGLRLRGAF